MAAVITLFDLANLSIGTPEAGAVNFNALQTLLHAIIKHLNIQDIKTEMPGEERGLYEPLGVCTKKEGEREDREGALVYHQMERKIQDMERQLEALNSLPSGSDLLERSKGVGQQVVTTPVADMWQVMQMKKRIETNEDGLSKVMELLQDLLHEIGGLKCAGKDVENQLQDMRKCVTLGGLNDLKERLSSLEQQRVGDLERLEKKLNVNEQMVGGLNDLHERVSQLEQHKTENVEGSQKKLDFIEQRVDGLTERLNQLEQPKIGAEDLERCLKKLDLIEQKMGSLNDLQERLSQLQQQNTEAENVDKLHNKLNLIEERVSHLEEKLTQFPSPDQLHNISEVLHDAWVTNAVAKDAQAPCAALAGEQDPQLGSPILQRGTQEGLSDTFQVGPQHGLPQDVQQNIVQGSENILKQASSQCDPEHSYQLSTKISTTLIHDPEYNYIESTESSEGTEGSTLKSDMPFITEEKTTLMQAPIPTGASSSNISASSQQPCGFSSPETTTQPPNIHQITHVQESSIQPDLNFPFGKQSPLNSPLPSPDSSSSSKLCVGPREVLCSFESLSEELYLVLKRVSALERSKTDQEDLRMLLGHADGRTNKSPYLHDTINPVQRDEQDLDFDKQKQDFTESGTLKKQPDRSWNAIENPSQEQLTEDAAGIRKQIIPGFHCLSCSRPVNIKVPGPQLITIPNRPAFPARHFKPHDTQNKLEDSRQHVRK